MELLEEIQLAPKQKVARSNRAGRTTEKNQSIARNGGRVSVHEPRSYVFGGQPVEEVRFCVLNPSVKHGLATID